MENTDFTNYIMKMAKRKEKSILARNIISRRNALRMNQEVFASKVGIGKTTLAEIETDVSEGWLSTRQAIADFLKCKVEDLYRDPNEKIEEKKPLDQAFMLTEAQLKELSENVAKHGVKAAMDAINKPSVSNQDTKNLSEKDKLILEITSSLPLLNINNIKGINNSIKRLISTGKVKKPVNS